jgi:hypothetical protein
MLYTWLDSFGVFGSGSTRWAAFGIAGASPFEVV